jgi:hypothetical protein
MLRVLRWRQGKPLLITAIGGGGSGAPAPGRRIRGAEQPVRGLPAPVRRRCGLHPGNRVLLAADPEHGVLVVHPLSALDTMITAYHTALLGGDGDEHTSR